jgi:hypothetical protein
MVNEIVENLDASVEVDEPFLGFSEDTVDAPEIVGIEMGDRASIDQLEGFPGSPGSYKTVDEVFNSSGELDIDEEMNEVDGKIEELENTQETPVILESPRKFIEQFRKSPDNDTARILENPKEFFKNLPAPLESPKEFIECLKKPTEDLDVSGIVESPMEFIENCQKSVEKPEIGKNTLEQPKSPPVLMEPMDFQEAPTGKSVDSPREDQPKSPEFPEEEDEDHFEEIGENGIQILADPKLSIDSMVVPGTGMQNGSENRELGESVI